MQVTFSIPNNIAQELNQIAKENGHSSAKTMVIAYLRALIRHSRESKAMVGIADAAGKQADIETEAISA